jgi:hypothetical protein
MLQTLITILISLNIQYGITTNGNLSLPNGNLKLLMEDKNFKEKVNNGTIHDLSYFTDDITLDDIVVVPDVDPNSIR